MRPHVFRVNTGFGLAWWVVSDGRGVMSCVPGEPRAVAVARWEFTHGRHPDGYEDMPGEYEPTEMAAEVCILVVRLHADQRRRNVGHRHSAELAKGGAL